MQEAFQYGYESVCGKDKEQVLQIKILMMIKKIYYHIYKCSICGEEKQMTEDEIHTSKNDADTLNEIIMKSVEPDIFLYIKIKEFFYLLNNISYDEKIQFMTKLIDDKNKFNKFTNELMKKYDSMKIYEIYK